MNSIYINGIRGAINTITSFKDMYQMINDDVILGEYQPLEIPNCVPSKVKRRMDRFSLLGVWCSSETLKMSSLTHDEIDKTGTVFNSVYGPLSTNIKFARHVVEDDPKSASPTQFANTVNNACMGHICMNLNLRGPSTMLMSGNYINVGISLLRKEKASHVLVGGIEEYCEPLSEQLKLQNIIPNESVVSMLLSTSKNELTQAQILGCYEEFIGEHGYVNSDAKYDVKQLRRIITQTLKVSNVDTSEVDLVIASSNGTLLDAIEINALRDSFGNKIKIMPVVTKLGESFGAGLGIGVGIAIEALKNEYKTVMVNYCDLTGGFRSVILRKAD
jgi:3-oxoacyl-(acyl-carrier-protein) synthase